MNKVVSGMDHGIVQECINEELGRKGVHTPIFEEKISSQSSKLLNFANNNFNFTREWNRLQKTQISPYGKLPDNSSSKTPVSIKFKNSSVSPFTRRGRFDRKSFNKKKEIAIKTSPVFETDLELLRLHCTPLGDGTLIHVPEFVIDINNVLRKNITLEGIFRKAGSAQRQNEYKRLLNSGKVLPPNIHPVDAACLLKQFLRLLPLPLLSADVHNKMIKCLELPETEQRDALILCSLLLSEKQRDLIAYVLELLSCVAAASSENQMDSRNLAIVLAPNLYPDSVDCSKKCALPNQDQVLSSTIEVVQKLIENATSMCRFTDKIISAIETKEKSRSMENLDSLSSDAIQKKKTASLGVGKGFGGFVNGFRRIVQRGGGQASQRTNSASSSDSSAPLIISSPVIVSMDPEGNTSTFGRSTKRKSDILLENLPNKDPSTLMNDNKEFGRPQKKARVDSKPAVVFTTTIEPTSLSIHNAKKLFNVKQSKIDSKNVENAKRRYSLRDKKESYPSPSSPRRRKSSVGLPLKKKKKLLQERKAPIVREDEVETPHLRGKKRPRNNQLLSVAQDVEVFDNSPMRRSSTRNIHRNNGNAAPLPLKKDLQIQNSNFSDISSIPSQDSGENKIPVQDLPKREPSTSDKIFHLERQYSDIKSAVRNLEKEVDAKNVEDFKDKFLKLRSVSDLSSSVSCSQLINDAYEKMKRETEALESSPSENLSRRLGRELKIRSRRSDEYRVIRSPSERKIEGIRRRSRELEQSINKLAHSDGLPLKTCAPKFKDNLLVSPRVSLRNKRGNPFSKFSPSKSSSVAICPLNTNSPKRMRKALIPSGYSPFCTRIKYSGPITRRMSNLHESPTVVSSVENSKLTPVRFNYSNSPVPKDSNETATSQNDEESFTKGCTQLLSIEGTDLSHSDLNWVSAPSFLNKSDSFKNKLLLNTSSNRPSIMALKEKKKVTANIHLFNNSNTRRNESSPYYKEHQDSKYSIHASPSFRTPRNSIKTRNSLRTPLLPLTISETNERSSKTSSSNVFAQPSTPTSVGSVNNTPKIMRSNPRVNSKRLKHNLPSSLTPLPPKPTANIHRFLSPRMTNTTGLKTPNRCPSISIKSPPSLPPKPRFSPLWNN